jgi:hypothetical protein
LLPGNISFGGGPWNSQSEQFAKQRHAKDVIAIAAMIAAIVAIVVAKIVVK